MKQFLKDFKKRLSADLNQHDGAVGRLFGWGIAILINLVAADEPYEALYAIVIALVAILVEGSIAAMRFYGQRRNHKLLDILITQNPDEAMAKWSEWYGGQP